MSMSVPGKRSVATVSVRSFAQLFHASASRIFTLMRIAELSLPNFVPGLSHFPLYLARFKFDKNLASRLCSSTSF
jgi:hypothetical protein